MAGGLSGFETPSYIYGAVFAFFLIMSLVIEKSLEFVEHRLAKLGRNGLQVALKSIVQEVMMLGFISLILIVIEDHLAEICGKHLGQVNNFSQYERWVSIRQISECDSCLKHTRGLSSEYKEEHHCPFWDDSSSYAYEKAPYDDDHATNKDDAYEAYHHRRLMAAGGEPTCGDGEEPLVSTAVLHEAHLAIFLLTVIHIANVVIMVLCANMRVNRWRRWKLDDDKYALCVSSCLRSVTLEPLDRSSEAPSAITVDTEMEVGNDGVGNEQEVVEEEDGGTETVKNSGSVLRILHRAGEVPQDNRVKLMVRWQTEWVVSFFKQFVRPVTQKEFRIMRASFMLEHRRAQSFNFMSYLVKALDDDVCEVVKISMAGWITLVVVQTLWAPVMYAGWALLGGTILFVCSVLLICTKLIVVVRHVTREGRINKLEPSVFWFSQPRLLLPVVRFTLFVNSAIFAIMASLAIQYGVRSCIFNGNSDHGGWETSSWILILFLNTGSFFHISFVMLPTYSLVVHMGSTHWSHHLLSHSIKGKIIDWRNRVGKEKPSTNSGRTAEAGAED